MLPLNGREIHTIYDLLDYVRERPGMWIGHAEVRLLAQFIGGFTVGVRAAHASLEQKSPPFRGFHDWVAARLGRRNRDPGWPRMLEASGNDEGAAFQRFWTELDAFRASPRR